MTWVDKKIESYKKGKKATIIEKRMLEHAEPVHFILAIIGVGCIVYGLWLHSWSWIIMGMVLNFVGHIFSWMKR